MRCSDATCVATNCPHQHQCNYCKHWMSTSAFGTKPAGRKKCCMKCSEKKKVNNAKSNPIANAKWNPINSLVNNPIANAKRQKRAREEAEERIAQFSPFEKPMTLADAVALAQEIMESIAP